MSNSHKTAIRRKGPSGPLQHALALGTIGRSTRVLDYGCGHGTDLAHMRQLNIPSDGYDPVFMPDPPRGKFDVVFCTYVLNTIRHAKERDAILRKVVALLKRDGVALISVRNDRRHLKGTTKAGTWQGYIELPQVVPIRCQNFDLYILTSEDIAPRTIASITV